MKTRIHHFLVLSVLSLLVALSSAACAVVENDSDVLSSQPEVTGRPYFETFRGNDNRHYFHLSAENHEIVLQSQGYKSRTSALNGVLSVRDNAFAEDNYKINQASNGEFYFNLYAANGQVIGTSELYQTHAGAEKGVRTVRDLVDEYNAKWAARKGARFDVYESASGRFYFNLRAANGEIVLQSQSYSSEAAALNGTFAVAENGVSVDRFELVESQGHTGWYFRLRAANGQIIGTSEIYASKSNAQRGCDAVVALLPQIHLL